ncbi:SUMF1/EgtB/PvdO family nonheme iron enzyme [Kiritimatiellaeota bacterium B1221]|nr:SUMF1/EgtB/PvdO family nonheme iron enzyme [Kiritimatiellaeota bacterium B1221]
MQYLFQRLWHTVFVLFFFVSIGFSQDAELPGLENSLGMPFQVIDPDTPLFCIWETRVKDYKMFTEESDRKWDAPDFEQSDLHPVVKVSWGDAVAFCRWLTLREQAAGILPDGARYRLPTSAEWDKAAGLTAVNPENIHRTDLMAIEYPWGGEWPPPQNAGNYHPDLRVDRYDFTSPVGSFSPSKTGLYDLGGNVWEWCMDPYNNALDFRVLRGASWRMRTPSDLQSRFRVGNVMNLRLDTYGFRVVLEIPAKLREETLKGLQKADEE